MNKRELMEQLKKETGYSEEQCLLVHEILESQLWFGKRGKEEIIAKFIEQLHLSQTEAEALYDISQKMIATALKDSLCHPFRSKDDE